MDVKDPTVDTDESSPSTDDDIRDLAGGAIVVFVGKAGRAARGGFLWVITLLCGLDVQGLYSSAWAICSTLNKVARFGLLRSVVYYVTEARARDEDDEAVHEALAAGLWIGLVASAVVVAGVHLTAEPIAALSGAPIAGALRIMSWTAPFIALSWVFTSATRALRIMRYEVYVRSIGGPLILFAGGAAVGLAGYGLHAIAWVQLVMAAGNLAQSVLYFQRHFSLRRAVAAMGRVTPWRGMARFGLPVTLSDFVYALVTQLDMLMLPFWFEPAVVGIFVLARRLASLVLKAPQAFDAIFSSVVSELSLRRRHIELAERYVTVARWILMVNLPIAACLLLVGDSLLQLLGASEVAAAADLEAALRVLIVLSVGMMVQSIFAVAEPLLAMSGRPTINLVNNVVWVTLNFGLNLWLIEVYGMLGVAIGAAVAMTAVALLRVLEVRYYQGIAPFHRTQLKPVLAAAVAGVPTWFLHGVTDEALWRAVLPVAAFLGVYAGALALLRLEKEDRRLLARMARAVRRRLGG